MTQGIIYDTPVISATIVVLRSIALQSIKIVVTQWSSPARWRNVCQILQDFPLPLLICHRRRNSQALSRKTAEQNQRHLSSSSSLSSSSNNSKAEGVTVPRKTPKEEQTKLVTDKTSPAVKEDNSEMPNSNRNTQLLTVEVHVYIHQYIPNSTEVSTSITDLVYTIL